MGKLRLREESSGKSPPLSLDFGWCTPVIPTLRRCKQGQCLKLTTDPDCPRTSNNPCAAMIIFFFFYILPPPMQKKTAFHRQPRLASNSISSSLSPQSTGANHHTWLYLMILDKLLKQLGDRRERLETDLNRLDCLLQTVTRQLPSGSQEVYVRGVWDP